MATKPITHFGTLHFLVTMMLETIKRFLNIINSEHSPYRQRLLYIALIGSRWEGWTFICGEREHVVSRGTREELREWAKREGWEVIEI